MSRRAQLNSINLLKIRRNQQQKRGLIIKTTKSFNLWLKPLSKFRVEQNMVSTTMIVHL